MDRPKGKDRIILALDVPNLDRAEYLVKSLAPHVGMFKVGLYLISSVGLPQIMAWFKKQGCDASKVFVDGKLHDIPNTIGDTARVISEYSVGMLNVHASSGFEGMKAAVDNSKSGPDTGGPEQYRDTLVLAVTILTSLAEKQCEEMYGAYPAAKVLQMAMMAQEAGVDGLICSPKEIGVLRAVEKLRNMLLVTPGIRPAWAVVGDQKRIMTPAEVVKVDGDYMVIGRPIINPPNEISSPLKAVELVTEEIETAEKETAEVK